MTLTYTDLGDLTQYRNAYDNLIQLIYMPL